MFGPYDISYTVHSSENPTGRTLGEMLPDASVDTQTLFSESHEYMTYDSGLVVGDIAQVRAESMVSQETVDKANQTPIEAMRVSDFNRLMEMQGAPPLELGENEFGIISTQPDMINESLKLFEQAPYPVELNGRTLSFRQGGVRDEGIWTSLSGYTYLMLIVPDNAVEGLPQLLDIYVANYAGDKVAADDTVYKGADALQQYSDATGSVIRFATKDQVRADYSGMTTMLIFVGIYLGLIFLIAAAAVLALQQLSEASDSKYRFDLLRKLGADEGMVSRALFSQVGTYFLLPLILALVHSVAGIYVMNSGINIIGGVDILGSAGITAILMAVVYGGYFLATYFGCRNIIHTKPERVD
jgi:putative ABC transport system permease protein